MNVVEDDTNTVKIEVTHIATKQLWSTSIENESQREHFQCPTAQWTLKVDDNTGLMTLSLTHPAVIEITLKMDDLKSIQKSPRTPKGDDDAKDDDFKEAPQEPSTPEPVQRELTEQEKKNLESYKEFTFKVVRIEDVDQIRIEMTHIASGLDFQQTVSNIIPQKVEPVVVPHKEDDAEEVVDGAAVNKLFGNEDSDDSDDEENNTEESATEEPKEEVVVEPPPPPPTMEEVLFQSKEDNALEIYLRELEKSPKTAYIELKFQLPDGEQKVVRLNQTQESIQRLVMKENQESYTLYEMAMKYTEETTSLLIEIKHLESGRDFEVEFGEEWLKKQFPEKYNPPPVQPTLPIPPMPTVPTVIPLPPMPTVTLIPPMAPIPTGVPIPTAIPPPVAPVPMVAPIPPMPTEAPIPTTMPLLSQSEDTEIEQTFKVFDKNGDGKITFDELKEVLTELGEEVTDKDVMDMIKDADLNGDGAIDFEEFKIMMNGSNNTTGNLLMKAKVVEEDVTTKKSESSDDAKEKESEIDQQPEPEPEPEVNPLEILMECIQKSKASNTLKMTMKGWNKKARIELRFTFNGTFNFNDKEKVISREEVIVVKRSKECIEKQTEMEQKEEEQQEADYIA